MTGYRLGRARRRLAVATMVLLILPAPLVAQGADEESLREQFERFTSVSSSEDLTRAFAFYAADAVRIPPGDRVLAGADAIREWFASAASMIDYALDDVEVQRLEVSGDLGYVLATYTEHWTPKMGGETTYSSGRWATIWRRGPDGEWKVAAEIWNLPPESAG